VGCKPVVDVAGAKATAIWGYELAGNSHMHRRKEPTKKQNKQNTLAAAAQQRSN